MSSETRTVTIWDLEQTARSDLNPARIPDSSSGIRIARAELPSPELSRFLYTAVGGDWTWTDRLPWTYRQWREFLERPGVETWVLYVDGTPAGFAELDGAARGPVPAEGGAGVLRAEGTVELSYFGLLPTFHGRGLGGHLLTFGAERAWDLADRWPELPATTRVWLHTCDKDAPQARANYERRGFRVCRSRTESEPYVPAPGPWPGAGASGR